MGDGDRHKAYISAWEMSTTKKTKLGMQDEASATLHRASGRESHTTLGVNGPRLWGRFQERIASKEAGGRGVSQEEGNRRSSQGRSKGPVGPCNN